MTTWLIAHSADLLTWTAAFVLGYIIGTYFCADRSLFVTDDHGKKRLRQTTTNLALGILVVMIAVFTAYQGSVTAKANSEQSACLARNADTLGRYLTEAADARNSRDKINREAEAAIDKLIRTVASAATQEEVTAAFAVYGTKRAEIDAERAANPFPDPPVVTSAGLACTSESALGIAGDPRAAH